MARFNNSTAFVPSIPCPQSLPETHGVMTSRRAISKLSQRTSIRAVLEVSKPLKYIPSKHVPKTKDVIVPLSKAEAKLRVQQAATELAPIFAEIDQLIQRNLSRVLEAFRIHRVGTHHFAGVDGYGHGDLGREVIEQIYAHLFGCEAALVRLQFTSGTHAIAAALYGILRPGDELLSLTGAPYDTLEEVIGIRRKRIITDPEEEGQGDHGDHDTGSLQDLMISYRELALTQDGDVDFDAIPTIFRPNTKMVLVQRSCGYSFRKSLSMETIARVVREIRAVRPDICIFVDNCYGELTEDVEPTHPSVGADLVAGSLIKNLGATIMPTGGYVCGRARYVRLAQNRLTAPGVEGCASLGLHKTLLQALFLAPQIVGESVKSAHLVANVMSSAGYEVMPLADHRRTDIIQSVKLGSRDKVVKFCETVQLLSPIGSYILPTPGTTPGYGDEVVFADGTFVDGSTLELSADGPLREPFAVFAQGGTHWTHWALVLEEALQRVGVTPKKESHQ